MNRFNPLFLCALINCASAQAEVVTYPAPAGEKVSEDFSISVNGQPVAVYYTPTYRCDGVSYAYFDFSGSAMVTIKPTHAFTNAAVLPGTFGVVPKVDGGSITFEVKQPRNLTIEMDGHPEHALHLFANPLEADAPKSTDTNVVYFGPGLHEIKNLKLTSGQTLYLGGGAIVRPRIFPEDKPTVERNWAGNKEYGNLFTINRATNVTVRGHGILDLSQLPLHARTAFVITDCDQVQFDGIIVIDAPAWVVAVFSSKHVTVRNIKQISRRFNSDGVDLCNTQDSLVEDCFLRNNDDEVCVKTTSPAPAQETKNVLVRNCVIWNERARGMGITSETRRNISNVTFRDCDIIHDFSGGGDCAALAVLVSDSGTMSNICFENIRVWDVHDTLIDCWTGADMWGHDKERGRVNGVVFRNITVQGPKFPVSKFSGFDAGHLIENVTFDNVRVNGQLIENAEQGRFQTNAFTRNFKFTQGSGAKP